MIHFQALGVLSLRGSDQREIESLLRRPKYLALLTYLAAARPRGFHRRDTLVFLLWPELDQAHARSALRSAVHYLRRTLGPGVVLARGEEELSVDADSLSSDFGEFEKAVNDGAGLHTALELYRGDFLAGFHVSEAPDFERWLDEIRDSLRRQAAEAASQLAAAEKEKGNVVSAVDCMRRAVEISNHDEDKVRDLIDMLAGADDRPGALRLYGELRRRLAAELDIEPSPATKALVDAIRSYPPRTNEVSRGEKPRQPVILEAAPKEVAPPPRREGGLITSQRRKPLRFLFAGIAVTLAVGGVLVARGGTSQPDSPLARADSVLVASTDPIRVVVFPFSVTGGPELGYLREGLAEVLSEAVDGLGDMRRVHPAAVLSGMRLGRGTQTLDLKRATHVASGLGARRYILGSVVGHGSRVAVSASLYDVGSVQPLAEASLDEEPERFAGVANRLTSALIANVPVGGGARLRQLGATGTTHFGALKFYSQGEALLRRAQYDSAVTKLRYAVEADSTFALAWYRLGMAYSLAQSMGLAGDNHASLDKAMRYSDKLSQHDKLLLHGWRAHFHGQPQVAERFAREIIGGYPESAEAWHLLGLTRMWYAWQRGRPYVESRLAFDRALAIDSRFPDAIYHAYWAAIFEGRYSYADSIFSAAPSGLVTGPWAHATRGLFAFMTGDRRNQESYTKGMETVGDQSHLGFAWILASQSDSLSAAERALSRVGGSAERSDWGKTTALIFLAYIEAARGRWGETQALFRRAALSDPAAAISGYALLAALPFFERPAEELSAIRDSVLNWRVPPAQRDSGRLQPQTVPEVLGIPLELRPWARDYFLGLLSVRLGDREAAERYANTLDAAANPNDGIGLRHDMALEIRASAALADGKPEAALQFLQRASMTVAHSNQVWYSPYHSRPLGRFIRAEALLQLGRDEEAAGWYGTLGEKYGTEFVYLAPALLRQAEIYERRGEIQRSLRYYGRFATRWQDGDLEYQPLVREIRTRMRELTRRSR